MNVVSAIVGGLFIVALVVFIISQIRGIIRDRKKRKELLAQSEKADGIDKERRE